MSFVRADDGRIRWTRLRRASQLAVLGFFIALPFANRVGVTGVLGSLASLRLGPVSLVDPGVGLASLLAGRTPTSTLLVGLALPVAATLALGPVFCSWVCPWGLVSEMLDRSLKRGPRRVPRRIGTVRWGILAAVMALSALIGLPLVATLSAPRAITVLPLELVFLGGATVATLSLVVALLVCELLLPRRMWCRVLCPVGSTLVLIRTPWTLGVRWRPERCDPAIDRLAGRRVCPWDLDPRRLDGTSGCTNCGACIEACPVVPGSALSFGFGGIRPPRGRRPPCGGDGEAGAGDRSGGSHGPGSGLTIVNEVLRR